MQTFFLVGPGGCTIPRQENICFIAFGRGIMKSGDTGVMEGLSRDEVGSYPYSLLHNKPSYHAIVPF